MKIVICPDKFKGSISAKEFCEIASTHLSIQFPESEIVSIPMADGGEGTTEILTEGRGQYRIIQTLNAIMKPIEAYYGILENGNKAIIDLSSASGLTKIEPSKRNPELTSTFGFGLMIKNAIERGAKEIILGIGGSATNDCGIGMLSALGVEFYDAEDNKVETIGCNLIKIENIVLTERFTTLIQGIKFTTACDVTNFLYGEDGAAYTYAPQKGADYIMCKRLDDGMKHFSEVVKRVIGKDLSEIIGGGAAGGVGATLVAILNSKMVSGAIFIAEELGLFEHIKSADFVITGEGKVDKQTLHNKLIAIVSNVCKKYETKMIVICGIVADNVSSCDLGAKSIIELKNSSMSVNESMNSAKTLLKTRMEDVTNLIR